MKTTNSVELSRNTTRLPIDHFRWLKQSIEHGGKTCQRAMVLQQGHQRVSYISLAAINL